MRLNKHAYWPIAAALVLAAAAIFTYHPYFAHARISEPAYLGSLPRGTITISSQQYTVLLALDGSAWQQGLMNASESDLLQSGAIGMLFVFPSNSIRCFWMENTPMQLRQAWIANNIMAYVYNATPYSTASVCHYGDYVLEVPASYNITLHAGSRATLQN